MNKKTLKLLLGFISLLFMVSFVFMLYQFYSFMFFDVKHAPYKVRLNISLMLVLTIPISILYIEYNSKKEELE